MRVALMQNSLSFYNGVVNNDYIYECERKSSKIEEKPTLMWNIVNFQKHFFYILIIRNTLTMTLFRIDTNANGG